MTDPIRRAQRLIAVRMHEDRGPDSLDAEIRRKISYFGLEGLRHRDSRRAGIRGWPDWVILGPGGVLYRELKSERGTLSPEQRHVASVLMHAGHDWAVWRPAQLLDGTIARQLREIT